MTNKRAFGCHVSASGGMENIVTAATKLNINTVQCHPSAPQRWLYKGFAKGIEDAYLKARESSPLTHLFFHGLYLINLANPDERMVNLSRQSLVYYLDLAERMQARGVIFHVGSLNKEPDPGAGYARAAAGINWALAQVKNNSRLILEVSAGSGSVIGAAFEDLAQIYALVEQKERVGFGLDSQHMWASGYDIRGDLAGVVKKLEDNFGFEKIWSIHLNDSKTALASHKDRHENLGDGLIGREALTAFINHPKLCTIPIMLETPGLKDEAGAVVEVEKLRQMVG